ncbi:MAG: hypothetical protein KJ607_08660 [Bacteroidetes bacterium]|nr:hypothetical protein [Bacteroidota bacterium]
MMRIVILLSYFLVTLSCKSQDFRTIHVFVALCDNESQGIVPVPEAIGNGDDPDNNLYWGAGYGVRTFFKRSASWKLLKSEKDLSDTLLERCIFRHTTDSVILVADAYRGMYIRQTVVDFLNAASGKHAEAIVVNGLKINAGGESQLLAYVGHDGLMDFSLDSYPASADKKKRKVIILACMSKSFFREAIRKAGATPLVWTTGLMAPEAYTLEAAIEGWVKNETNAQIREHAAQAYHKYQKCGIGGARGLLVTGF